MFLVLMADLVLVEHASPKDSYAFIKHFQEKGISLTVLENAFAENNKIRSKYKEKTTREIEQNVTFENLYKSSPKK